MDLRPVYQKLRFLVIDDFDNFRVTVRRILHELGAQQIDIARHGEEAVEKCRYERFDVVLCDYNLGKGKNGQQILEELRFRKLLRRTSLFILVTAETSKEIVMGARDWQPDGYLAKPITRAVLEKRLGSLLVQREALLPINREIDKENYPKAISLCHAQVQSGSKYTSWCLKTMADLYVETGDYAHAQKIYEDVLSKRLIPWAEYGLATVLAAQRHYDRAIQHFEALIDAYPDMVEAYDGLARIYREQGNLKQARAQLKKALERSPLSIARQESLGDISQQLQDLELAVSAYKAAIKLGQHSCFASPEHYLKCGDSLSDLCEMNDGAQKTQYANDAVSLLEECVRRYQDIREVLTRSLLIEGRVYQSTGEQVHRDEVLSKARKMIGDGPVSAPVGLDMAKTLFRMDKVDEAQRLLLDLAARYEEDSQVMARIEAMLEEPADLSRRLQARSHTKAGISAFEKGVLSEAVQHFEMALEIAPRHPALNLNLVQVLLKLMETQGTDPALVRRCHQALANLEHLPAQHRQYKRYQFLQKKVSALGHH